MPSVTSTSSYNFKLVDFTVTKNGYLLKVANVVPANKQTYLAYLPFGRYTSVLMLEYLIAKKTEFMSINLEREILNAVKQDIAGEVGSILLLSDRTTEKPSALIDEKQEADRVSSNLNLNIIKDIHISTNISNTVRMAVRPLASTLSYKVSDHELFIDFIKQGNRPDSFAAAKSEHYEGLRTYTKDLQVLSDRLLAERPIDHNVLASKDYNTGNRLITHGTTNPLTIITGVRTNALSGSKIVDEMLKSSRSTNHLSNILRDNAVGTRDVTSVTNVIRNLNVGLRDINNITTVLRDRSSGLRDVNNITTITREYTIGRLVVHSYDATIHKLGLSSMRSITQNTNILHLGGGIRYANRNNLYVPKDMAVGSRTTNKNTVLHNVDAGISSNPKNMIIVTSETAIWESLKEMYITREVQSDKESQKLLYVPKDMSEGVTTGVKQMTITGDVDIADRSSEKATTLFLIGESLRDVSRSTFIQEVLNSKLSPKDSILLDTDFGALTSRKASLEEEITGFINHLLQGSFEEEVTGFINHSHQTNWIDDMLTAFNISNRYGTLTDSLIASFVSNERISSILEDILSTKGFGGHIMEDTIFANRHSENPSWSLEEADYLVGVKERLQTLIDYGILSSKTPHSSLLLLSDVAHKAEKSSEVNNSLFEGEHIILRPSVTDEQNPIGNFQPKPSSMEELVNSDLQQRLTFLSVGFVFGKKEARGSCLADMFYATRASLEHGDITDAEFMNFATLALKSSIIEEQLMAKEPGLGTQLLEDIIAFTDPFPTVNTELTEADKLLYFAETVNQLLGDPVLAKAVIDDYVVAVKRVKEGFVDSELVSIQDFKKSILEQSVEASGLIYDYTVKDVLDSTDDPENWIGGFGVPEDYDSHDPFNEYYPWSKEIGSLQLAQEDWVRFGDGDWTKDSTNAVFHANTETPTVGGYFHNNFSKKEYVFSTDFKVEGVGNDAVGVVYHYKDASNYTMFSVSGGDSDGSLGMASFMQVYKVVNGVATAFGSAMNPFKWDMDKWYNLEVTVLSGKVKIKVDGRLQYEYSE